MAGFAIQMGMAALAGAALFGGAKLVASSDTTLGAMARNCTIKGNVSINTGQRIYHVPGQMFYFDTKISPEYGERWFCSEAEARQAGWRKARR